MSSRQHGLITRAQLTEAGVTRQQVRTMVHRGSMILEGARTYRIAAAPRTALQHVMAACLDARGAASHQTAAWMHELADFRPGSPPEVATAQPRREYRTPLARLHTSTNLGPKDLTVVRGVPCLSVARTLFSLASAVPQELSLELVARTVGEAIADGKAREAWLWERLEEIRCRGRKGVSVFEGILVARAGGDLTESWLERETLRVLAAAGLPLPVCQQRIDHDGAFVARVDFTYVEDKVIIEVDGYRHHRTPEQVSADAARRRALTLLGYRVLVYTYEDVVRRPAALVHEVTRALSRSVAA